MADDRPMRTATSIDPKTLALARDAVRNAATVDPEALALASEAARNAIRTTAFDAAKTFAGLDARMVPSLAETFRALDTTRIGDMAAISAAAKAIPRPIVAPQISEQLGASLKAINAASVGTFAEAVSSVRASQAFDFKKMMGDYSVRGLAESGLLDSLRTLKVSPAFTASVSEMLRDLEPRKLSIPSARFEEIAEEAVALAEVEDVAEIVDEAVGELKGMSVAKKRTLALEVLLLIAAFLALAGWLSHDNNLKGEAMALGCAAALVRVYWRLTDKLD
jgi:hypothetical protein